MYIFADQIKAGVPRAVAEMPYPAPEGPPLKERKSRIAELDSEIEKLERQLADVETQAAEAGISLRGRPQFGEVHQHEQEG